MRSMIGSRFYLKYRTAIRIHKKLPCKYFVRKLLEFTHNTNVGFPVSKPFCILYTNSVVMIPSLSSRRCYSQPP